MASTDIKEDLPLWARLSLRGKIMVILAVFIAFVALELLIYLPDWSPSPSYSHPYYTSSAPQCGNLIKLGNLSDWCTPNTVWNYRGKVYLGTVNGSFCPDNIHGRNGAIYIIRERILSEGDELCIASIYGVSTKATSVSITRKDYEMHTEVGKLLLDPFIGTHEETYSGAIGLDGASYYFDENRTTEIFAMGSLAFNSNQINFCSGGAPLGTNIIYPGSTSYDYGCSVPYQTDEEKIASGYTIGSIVCENSNYSAVRYTKENAPEETSVRLSPKGVLKFHKILETNAKSAMQGISDLTCLTYLSFDPAPLAGSVPDLTDLSPIDNLTNLETLIVPNTHISDLSSLTRFARLQFLSLASDHSVLNISAVVGLHNLKYFYLLDINLIDLTPLLDMPNLKKLGIVGSRISDPSPLKKLTNLEYLNLQVSGISHDWCDSIKSSLANTSVFCSTD